MRHRTWVALTRVMRLNASRSARAARPLDRRPTEGRPGLATASSYAEVGLLPLLALQLRHRGLAPDAKTAGAYALTLASNLPIRQALRDAAVALHTAGVSAIAYKGQDYLERIYGDLGARTMADADLLIRPQDRARAARALITAGFVPDRKCRTEHERKFFKDGVAIDLHHRLLQTGRTRVDHEMLFARALPSPLGHGLLQLEATDALLVHCIAQMNKGYALPASSYVELHALMCEANLQTLIRRARAYRVVAAVYVSMSALTRLGHRDARRVAQGLGLGTTRRRMLDPLVGFAQRHTAVPAPARTTLLVIKTVLVDDGVARVRSLPRWVWAQVGPPLDAHQLA